MMKKVLLLGDSIRLGYQSYVKDKLDGLADVVGPEENCRFAKYTLWNVDQWTTDYGRPDVIHWNNGIWDIQHRSGEHGIFTPLEEYVATIQRVLLRLRKTGAQIVWATTTAVDPRNQQCKNEEIDIYNQAIVQMMHAENIDVNDLNHLIKGNIASYIDNDLVHLTAQGSEACADAVAGAVKKYL